MDKKNQVYDAGMVTSHIKESAVYHVERTCVTWGVGGVNAELLLLKKAVSVGSYQHYHLLSGADLPIKTQEQIVSFFEANKDKENIPIYILL